MRLRGPTIEVGADPLGDSLRLAGELTIREVDDDESGGGHRRGAHPVELELVAVATVRLPTIALHHDDRPGKVEVDLVAGDDGVESRRGQTEALQHTSHHRLEDAVDGFAVQFPIVERSAQRGHAGPAASGVDVDGGAQRPR